VERDDLVDGLITGDEQAWRRFVAEYGGVIYAVATGFGFSEADRDDLFQNTCLTAVRSIHTLRDSSRLSSWIYSVAYRLAIDTRRRQRGISLEDLAGESHELPGMTVDPTITEALQRIEEAAQLHDALERLDPRCRRLLKALYLEEPQPGYAEISKRERMPIGSIGPTRARCLKKIRKLLEEISNTPPDPSTKWDPHGRVSSRDLRKGR
jgi:RNA polymerase sigma factor (sigma-70 family)